MWPLTSGGTTITNLTLLYDASGNITSKSDVGAYAYPASGTSSVRPHAVSTAGTNSYSYDADGNLTTKNGDALTWYSYNLPNRINKGSNYAQFSYGAGRQRYKQVAVTAAGGNLPAGTETTLYVGSLFEQVTKPSGVIEYKHYLMAGKEAVAIKTLRSNSANDLRYLHKDHLGSVDAITDESGTVITRMSFDAFGKRRSTSTWSGSPTAGDWTSIAALTHRAFTFHEQLDNVDLVHMNGRVYDPTIGRFISADPTIQAPFMSQSLNRYSYVMNNPLSLIDPSGFSWLSKALKSVGHFISTYWKPIVAIVVAVLTYGIVNAWMMAPYAGMCVAPSVALQAGIVAGAAAGAVSGAMMGGAKGALIGAASGALFGAIGGYYGNTWTMGRVAANGIAGGISSEIAGGSFEDGLKLSAALSMVQFYYNKVMKYDVTWKKGEGLASADGTYDEGARAVPQHVSVFGTNSPDGFLRQGGKFAYYANKIPGMNSLSRLHDSYQMSFGSTDSWTRTLLNVPAMVPATLVNYGALLSTVPGYPAILEND